MIVRNLLSLLRGRRPSMMPRPQVLVTLERPWEAGRVRRFGAVDEVLGDLTVQELVESLAEAAAPQEPADGTQEEQNILPVRYDIQVRGIIDADFRPVSGDAKATSLLGDSLTAEDGPRVHQLRIQVLPLPAEGNEQRTAPARHSDRAVEEAPEQTLDEIPEVEADEVLIEPVVCSEPAVKPEAPKEPSAPKLRGYMRKADVIRAELLPKIEALDFSGLFVGNFGIQARTLEKAHRVSLLDPQTANKYLVLANQHRRDGEYEKAVHYYKTLVTHDPDNEDFWFLLGKTAAEGGRLRQAVHAFATARRLGHAAAKEELARLRAEHPEIAEQGGDLLKLWRQSYT